MLIPFRESLPYDFLIMCLHHNERAFILRLEAYKAQGSPANTTASLFNRAVNYWAVKMWHFQSK